MYEEHTIFMATSNSYILNYKEGLGKVTEINKRLIYR